MTWTHYTGEFNRVGGRVQLAPGPAKLVLAIVALPGVVLVVLSVALVLCSILVLLLTAGPVYLLVKGLGQGSRQPSPVDVGGLGSDPQGSERKKVDATMVE